MGSKFFYPANIDRMNSGAKFSERVPIVKGRLDIKATTASAS